MLTNKLTDLVASGGGDKTDLDAIDVIVSDALEAHRLGKEIGKQSFALTDKGKSLDAQYRAAYQRALDGVETLWAKYGSKQPKR